MSNSNISNVLSKIAKLRALAKNNSNENEMKAAAAAADSLAHHALRQRTIRRAARPSPRPIAATAIR